MSRARRRRRSCAALEREPGLVTLKAFGALELASVSSSEINELEKASIIAIGAPMYNFTIPSSLKAWVDHIVRLGRTFAYVDGAPKGLLPPGKKVFVMTASGG